jgi:hypothetical protein
MGLLTSYVQKKKNVIFSKDTMQNLEVEEHDTWSQTDSTVSIPYLHVDLVQVTQTLSFIILICKMRVIIPPV